MAYATKEKRNAYAREYQRKPEKIAYKKAYYAALSPEKKAEYRESSDDWHKRNHDKDIARMKAYVKGWREKALAKLGNKCANPGCGWVNTDGTHGCDDKRCLQIDHVHGGGSKEQKATGVYYKKVVADQIGNYQLLCANCNWIKRAVNKEHLKR
jgi:hypothetical protein